MSNIHTLRDSQPNREPLPDPWKKHPQRYVKTDLPDYEVSVQPVMQFYYNGIDGEKILFQKKETPTCMELCCLGTCPCCVPPLCDDTKQKAYIRMMKSFTFAISAVQFVLMLVALGMGGVVSTSTNPSIGPGSDTLVTLGAKDGHLIQNGEVWRFVTPIFLHAGLVHLFFNLFSQLRYGLALERRWGLLKFIPLYFVSGIGGVLLSCLIKPDTISVGASGAIMGLMGGNLAEVLMTWHNTDDRVRKMNLIQLVLVIFVIMMLSLSPYIDIGAHLGGLIVGFLMGMVYFAVEYPSGGIRKYGPLASIALLAAFFIIGFVVFYAAMDV